MNSRFCETYPLPFLTMEIISVLLARVFFSVLNAGGVCLLLVPDGTALNTSVILQVKPLLEHSVKRVPQLVIYKGEWQRIQRVCPVCEIPLMATPVFFSSECVFT